MLQVISGPTIEAGESLSDAIDCSAGQLVCVTMPSGWDNEKNNKNTCLTFQFSPDGEVWSELCTFDGYAVTVPIVVPGSSVVVSADVGRATAWIKFRSGTAGNPFPQTEVREFSVAIMPDAASAQSTPQSISLKTGQVVRVSHE